VTEPKGTYLNQLRDVCRQLLAHLRDVVALVNHHAQSDVTSITGLQEERIRNTILNAERLLNNGASDMRIVHGNPRGMVKYRNAGALHPLGCWPEIDTWHVNPLCPLRHEKFDAAATK